MVLIDDYNSFLLERPRIHTHEATVNSKESEDRRIGEHHFTIQSRDGRSQGPNQ